MGVCVTPVIVFCASLVSLTNAQIYDWRNAPYGNDDFNVRAEYARDTMLECVDDRVANTSYTAVKWILPDMEIMYPGQIKTWETIDGTAGWEVSPDGMKLNLTLVQDGHFGFYYCLLNTSDGTEYAIKTALNFKGAYWAGSVWWRYKDASIYAIAFSLAYGVLCILLSWLWTCVGPKTDATYAQTGGEDDVDFDTILAKLGYDNTGFSANDDDNQEEWNAAVMNNAEVEVKPPQENFAMEEQTAL